MFIDAALQETSFTRFSECVADAQQVNHMTTLTQTHNPTAAKAMAIPTLHLSASDVAAIIHRQGLSNCIEALAERIQCDFLRWPQFDKSARVASYSAYGVIELMPIADDQNYAFKCVNGHPQNPQKGLSTVMAFGVLLDVATGIPLLVSELTFTTALRTAATSAMAARALARPDSRVMAIIGNGAQSEFQALAFQRLLGITTLRLFDVDVAASIKLVHNLESTNAGKPGLDMQVCVSIADAVQGADIVTTLTADKAQATILTPEMIEPGMHLNAVGGDCPGKTELHADVLRGASVFVEYPPQTRVEGDIQQLALDFPVTALWEVLGGAKSGRVSATQVTVFDSVGFALEDFSALVFLRDTAQALGIGTPMDLIPVLDNPKDLFGRLTRLG